MPNPEPGEEFRRRARDLLSEIDQAGGPAGLPDWNLRAQTLLVFEACRRLERRNDVILDARKFSLPADAEVKKLDIAEPCREHPGKELIVLGVVGSRERRGALRVPRGEGQRGRGGAPFDREAEPGARLPKPPPAVGVGDDLAEARPRLLGPGEYRYTGHPWSEVDR